MNKYQKSIEVVDTLLHLMCGEEREDGYLPTMEEMSDSMELLTEIKYSDGTVIVKEAFTRDGEWTVEKRNTNCKVIAWMPFPEPYKEKENE